MDDTHHAAVAAVGLALLLVTAGCGQVIGGGSGPRYQGEASNFLLTAEEIGGGWERNVTRDPDINASRIDSGRVVELTNGSAELQISVLIFPSAADSAAFLDEQRAAYDSAGLNATNISLGDGGIAARVSTGTYLEVRQANAYVQVVGNVDPKAARRIASAQLEKLRIAEVGPDAS